MNRVKPTSVRAWSLSMAALLGLAGGCNRDRSPRLADYLDELEFDVPLETAAYVPLGKFEIPIAANRKDAQHETGGAEVVTGDAVLMKLLFELTAETAPPYEKAVLEAAERHRGALNDAVLTIVRTSTVEELADPRLAAVKARLSEITRPMLGEDIVRQLVFNKLDAEAMKRNEASAPKKSHGGHH
jgi:hypothetical protein